MDGVSLALKCVQTRHHVQPNSTGAGFSQNRDSQPDAVGFAKKLTNPIGKPVSGVFDVQITLHHHFYTAGLAAYITIKLNIISRIANAVSSWEGISLFLSVLVGVGCLAFVAFSWGMHFAGLGNYFAVGGIALASMVVSLAPVERVPVALILLFGSAVIVGTVFSVGASNVVMP